MGLACRDASRPWPDAGNGRHAPDPRARAPRCGLRRRRCGRPTRPGAHCRRPGRARTRAAHRRDAPGVPLSGPPLRLFDAAGDDTGRTLSAMLVVGGARSALLCARRVDAHALGRGAVCGRAPRARCSAARGRAGRAATRRSMRYGARDGRFALERLHGDARAPAPRPDCSRRCWPSAPRWRPLGMHPAVAQCAGARRGGRSHRPRSCEASGCSHRRFIACVPGCDGDGAQAARARDPALPPGAGAWPSAPAALRTGPKSRCRPATATSRTSTASSCEIAGLTPQAWRRPPARTRRTTCAPEVNFVQDARARAAAAGISPGALPRWPFTNWFPLPVRARHGRGDRLLRARCSASPRNSASPSPAAASAMPSSISARHADAVRRVRPSTASSSAQTVGATHGHACILHVDDADAVIAQAAGGRRHAREMAGCRTSSTASARASFRDPFGHRLERRPLSIEKCRPTRCSGATSAAQPGRKRQVRLTTWPSSSAPQRVVALEGAGLDPGVGRQELDRAVRA